PAIFESNAERLADEKRREATAVYEEVTRNVSGLPRRETLDITRFVLVDLDDVRPDVADAELFRAVPREEGGELAGVQMVCAVREPLVLGARDHFRREPVIAQAPLRGDEIAKAASWFGAEPVRHQVELRESLRKHERVVVGVILGAGRPARELTALLEGRIALAEELRFRYTHPLQRCAHRWPG